MDETNVVSQQAIKDAKAKMSTELDKTKLYVNKEQSQAYIDGRPRYSDEMFKYIADFVKKGSPSMDLAVDVGCGPGCSTFGFAKYFKKVVGVDVSPTQIEAAPTNIPNMEFKVGYSHQLPFIKSGTVDLFCSGESFNLMPRAETYAEADRVLKPGGTIALFGYSTVAALKPEIDEIIKKMYVKFLPYWPKESQLILNKFRDVEIPYPGYTRNEEMVAIIPYTLDKFMALVRSFWPFVAYTKQHPEDNFEANLESDMRKAIAKVNGSESNMNFDMSYDLFILMGHKPKK